MILSRNASASCIYFCEKAPNDAHDILENHDFEFDLLYRKAMIEKRIYQIPIACKQASVSYAHSVADIELTLERTRAFLNAL